MKHEAKKYRGITVLPIIEKCIDFLLQKRLIDILQNRLQRGIPPQVSPLLNALILYESILEAVDMKITLHHSWMQKAHSM